MDSEINKIKNFVVEIIVNIIADLIVEKIRQESKIREKRLLVIFSGGSYGFSESIASIKALIDEGYKTNIVLSERADQVLGRKLVKQLLGVDRVYVDGDENIDQLLDEGDILILPSLTINSAAKIACCISDNYLTRAVNKFLLSDKAVYAATNCCCPKDDERVLYSMNPRNHFYEKKMIDNMEILKSYGIRFSHSKDIYNQISNIHLEDDTKTYYSDKKILTNSDVVMLIEGSVLKVQKGCILTSLAQEQLVKNRIKIELIG